MNSPAIFDRLGSWGGVAIALAILAYAGPIHEQLSQRHSRCGNVGEACSGL